MRSTVRAWCNNSPSWCTIKEGLTAGHHCDDREVGEQRDAPVPMEAALILLALPHANALTIAIDCFSDFA